MSAPDDERLRLTDLLGRPVSDDVGRSIGRIADVIVGHQDDYPRVVGIAVQSGRSLRLIPWSEVTRPDGERAIVRAEGCEAPVDGLRLAHDLLDAQVVDLSGHRLARVGEIELVSRDGSLQAAAVDVGLSSVVRRLGLGRLARHLPSDIIDWRGMHFATRRARKVQLETAAGALHRRRYRVMRARTRAPS